MVCLNNRNQTESKMTTLLGAFIRIIDMLHAAAVPGV